jgi:hypothetical protein
MGRVLVFESHMSALEYYIEREDLPNEWSIREIEIH